MEPLRDRSSEALERVGAHARAELDAALSTSERDLRAVRARLEGRVRGDLVRPRATLAWAAPVAVAAVLLVAVLAWPRTLRFTVAGFAAAPGAYVAAGSAPSTIRFSDGTEFDVQPATHGRVTTVDRHGARLVLERGVAIARVHHLPDAEWHVAAGPFDVHVVGTKFQVSWDPEREVFRLDLHEGAVVVSGGLLDRGRSVGSGQTLLVSVREGRTDLVPTTTLASASPSVPASSSPSAAASASAAIEIDPILSFPSSTSAAPPPRPWQPLATAGKYAAALEQAKQLGFANECAHDSARDVLLLGDVARLAGDGEHASDAYRAVRKRFPKSGPAAAAAFALGRLAFDRAHAYSEAATWFETSLHEGGGGFAREAAGRLIEAKKAAGDLAGAKTAARNYLDKYPDGPHATLAKTLAGE